MIVVDQGGFCNGPRHAVYVPGGADKAARWRPEITELSPTRFLINGSAGARFVVHVTTVGIECACPAGSLGNPCYHAGWLFSTRVAAGLAISRVQVVTANRDSASAPLAERSGL